MSLAKLNYGFCTYDAGEALEDLISDLLNIILKNFGEVTIAKLEKDFVSLVNHRFMHPNVLRSFLQKYPQIFEHLRSNKW
jgi:hypothetical protein